jgi:hypothetical protein
MQTGDRLGAGVAVAGRACQGRRRWPNRSPRPASPAKAPTSARGIRTSRCGYGNDSGLDDLAAGSPRCGDAATGGRAGGWQISAIGTVSGRVTMPRHGVGSWRGLMAERDSTAPRQPDLLADRATGRALAELDRAA